jgi:ribosome-binding factor A
MNNPLRWTKNVGNLCAEFGEEDGIEPRYLTAKQASKKVSRKNLQLCKEAARIIALVLTGEAKLPLLRDLQVLSVEPEADGQQLCVSVGLYANDVQVSEAQVLESLHQVQGLLRSALAHALHRKHTPTLNFRYVAVIGKGDY